MKESCSCLFSGRKVSNILKTTDYKSCSALQRVDSVGNQLDSSNTQSYIFMLMKTLIKSSHFWSHFLCVFSMKDIHYCFMTRSQVKVTVSNAKMTLWFLKIIKTPSNLNHPPIVESDFSIMYRRWKVNIQCYSIITQWLFYFFQDTQLLTPPTTPIIGSEEVDCFHLARPLN